MAVIYAATQKAQSWAQTTSLAVVRPGPNSFVGMVLAFVVLGRERASNEIPAVTPPAGFSLLYSTDHTDDPYPSSFYLYYKRRITGEADQPASYLWQVQPARSMQVHMSAFLDAYFIAASGRTSYLGDDSLPQYERDPALIRTGDLTPGEMSVFWAASVSWGIVNEFGFNTGQPTKSLIADPVAPYTTILWPAGTYYIALCPQLNTSWNTSEGTAQVRILRTAVQRSMGRRLSPSTVDLFGSSWNTAGTITDPPVGTTLVRSNFAAFNATPDPVVQGHNSGYGAYTGWLKLVLTEPMYLSFDTYGSSMVSTYLLLWNVDPPSGSAVRTSFNTLEYPYRSASANTSVGLTPWLPSDMSQMGIDFASYTQTGLWRRSEATSTYMDVWSQSGDYDSPRRVGVHVRLDSGRAVQIPYSYEPGSVLVNGSPDDVIETDPSQGMLIVPATGTATITFTATGGSAYSGYTSTGSTVFPTILGSGNSA